jgi:transposase
MLEVGIYDKSDLRNTIEGILYRLRVGCPWRDLPEQFGKWSSIYKRFNYWSRTGKLMAIFQKLSEEPDFEWRFIDGTIVKAHQHSCRAVKGMETAIGKSVAGNTSKIHMAVDACGNPVCFEITGGQLHDVKAAPDLISQLPKGGATIADRGYDSDPLRDLIKTQESKPVIPRKKNSKVGNDDIDWALYRLRHLVENIFARLKHFRSIATRYDKLKKNYQGMLALACSFIWLPL